MASPAHDLQSTFSLSTEAGQLKPKEDHRLPTLMKLPSSFRLWLVRSVGAEPTDANMRRPWLAALSATWLYRKLHHPLGDRLILIGHGYADLRLFESDMARYGLQDAELHITETAPGQLGYEDEVESILGSHAELRNAVPLATVPTMPEPIYPHGGWWWIGVEAAGADYLRLTELLPDRFTDQSATWEGIVDAAFGAEEVQSPSEEFDHRLHLAALARWLHGFNEASGNSYYDLDAEQACSELGISIARLGFEAGHRLGSDLELEVPEAEDDGALLSLLFRACVSIRLQGLHSRLVRFFGDAHVLHYSLHATIWPRYDRMVDDAVESFLNDLPDQSQDLQRAYWFVQDGWDREIDDE